MDVTPVIPPGRQVIDRYGPGGFRIAGVDFSGGVLVFPEASQPWMVTSMAGLTAESLAPVIAHGEVEILLLGCGARMGLVPRAVREALRARGIVIDAMDTGAACRTYAVLARRGTARRRRAHATAGVAIPIATDSRIWPKLRGFWVK
jgi:uncharacterized protein